MSDEPESEAIEETGETPEQEYEPGGGNQILDSLFSLESNEKPEETDDETLVDPTRGDQTISSVAMSLTDSLAAIADAPAEEPDEEESPRQTDVPPPPDEVQAEQQPTVEALGEADYFDNIDKEFETAPEQTPESTPLDMTEDEKEEYLLHKFASAMTKHQGAERRYLEYHHKKKDFLAKARDDDPDFEESMDNHEFAEFVSKHRPALSDRDRRKIEKEMTKSEVMAEVSHRMAQDNHQRDIRNKEPQLRKRAEDFQNELVNDLVPEEIRTMLDNGEQERAHVEHALEMPALNTIISEANAFGSVFLQLSNGLVTYNAGNPQHTAVLEFVNTQGTIFAKDGGKDRFRGKSKFVPRKEYHQLKDRKGYWTFSDNEVLEMIKFYAKETSDKNLADIKARLDAHKTAKPAKTSPAPAPVEEPLPAPKASPTKSTGATSSAEGDTTHTDPILSVLGL